MSYLTGNPGNIQSASEIVVSAFEQVSPETLSVRYPEIMYPDFVPSESVDTNVPEGADIYSKVVKDRRGVGSFRAVGSNDVNMVGFSQGKISTPIFNSAVGSVLDLQDIARGAMALQKGLGVNAVTEATETMKIASDRHIERLMFFGDTVKDTGGDLFYDGLINNSNVPTSTVAVGAGAATTLWINGANSKTPDEVIYDLSVAINSIYLNTRGILIPTDVYLPLEQFAYITSLKAGTRANDEVVFNFVSQQNVSAAINGMNINIRPLRYLQGAGAGGANRMIVATKQPENYMAAMPIPFRQLTTNTFGFLEYLFGEYKISPLVLPYPQAFGYWDGI